MNITIRQLQVFLEVAKHNSFTVAAQNLHLTQPAVSMQIKQLEQVVGVSLMTKQGKKIQLSDAGYEIQRLSRTVLRQIDQAEQHIEQLSEGYYGRLKLVVASTIASVATKLLASFKEQNQNLHINFDVTNREGLIEHLVNNQADIVMMGQPPDDLNLISDEFMENPLVVIASHNHPLTRLSKPATLTQLLEYGFIIRESGSGTRLAMERFFKKHDKLLNTNMEMNSNDAIKQSVEAGLGLGIVSIHTLENEIRENRLKIINAEGFPIIRMWYLVQLKDQRLSPMALKFKEFLLKNTRINDVKNRSVSG